ncbi:unnamed protein product [Blepharisma stoltei]|uniref:Uncharacterized protein n=1 Tax=Blepharisma stoltei TaxID=1481888 RepID=A0AAU9J618_9CILI|nr:unnamed protein product [Blepharisma stoltei]
MASYLPSLALVMIQQFNRHSKDYMINQGFDYNDPYQINSAIRVQKFNGCTGVVTIEKNDRAISIFDIMASKIDKISRNVTAYKMAEFRAYGCTILSIKLLH